MFRKDILETYAKDAIKSKFSIHENNKGGKRVITCLHPGCPFTIEYVVNEYQEVTVLKERCHSIHQCEDKVKVLNSYVKVLLAQIITETMTFKELKQIVIEQLDIDEDNVDFSAAKAALSRAKNKLFGQNSTLQYIDSFVESYNAANSTKMEVIRNESSEIEAVYIDFPYSSILGGVPEQLVFLDGTHSKSSYKATILLLCCPTCVRTVLPIAVLWCRAENIVNTRLLFERAVNFLHPSCIIKSDDASCFSTVIEEFKFRHSLCTYHIKAKFHSRNLETLFDNMYSTYSINTYNSLKQMFTRSSSEVWKRLSTKLDKVFRFEGAPPNYRWEGSSPIESVNSAILQIRKKSLLMFCSGIVKWSRERLKETTNELKRMKQDGIVVHESVMRLIQIEREKGVRRFAVDRSKSTKSVIYMEPRKKSDATDIGTVIYINGCTNKAFNYRSTPITDFQRKYISASITSEGPVCSCREMSNSGIPCQHLASILPQDELVKLTNHVWKLGSYEALIDIDITEPVLSDLEKNPASLADQRAQPGRPKTKRIEFGNKPLTDVRRDLQGDLLCIKDLESQLCEFDLLLSDMDEYPLIYKRYIEIVSDVEQSYHTHLTIAPLIPKRAKKGMELYLNNENRYTEMFTFIKDVYTRKSSDMISLFNKQLKKDSYLMMKQTLDQLKKSISAIRFQSFEIDDDFHNKIENKLLERKKRK